MIPVSRILQIAPMQRPYRRRIMITNRESVPRAAVTPIFGSTPQQFQLLVHLIDAPGTTINVTDEIVAIIARAISDLHRGNEVLNWLEAEMLLRDLFSGARSASNGHRAQPGLIGAGQLDQPLSTGTDG